MQSQFNRMVPYVQISNADKSIDFYCQGLGFIKNWVHQFEKNFPKCISVSRDQVELYLTEHPESAAGAKYFFLIEDVDTFYQECLYRKLVIESKLENDELGFRSFTLKDPDGNILVFNSILK